MASDASRFSLRPPHVVRLRSLAKGPKVYRAGDSLNLTLVRRGLIEATGQAAPPLRREYAITDQGRAALREADRAN